MERGDSSRGYGPDPGGGLRTDRENTVVDITGTGDDENSQSEGKSFGLVGKLICGKPPNGYHLMEILRKSWKTQQEFSAREWRKNLFLFSFQNSDDRNWVLKRQPWHFDGHLFAISELNGSIQPSNIKIDKGSLWVRAYDLPMKCTRPAILRCIAKKVGMVEEIDTDDNFAGCFARFKVSLDITMPLLRGITISFEGQQLWIPLKYESLPIFCYRCGLIGHHTRSCEQETEEDGNGKHFEDLLYGPTLKASPLKRVRPPKTSHTQTHNHYRKPRTSPLSHNPIITDNNASPKNNNPINHLPYPTTLSSKTALHNPKPDLLNQRSPQELSPITKTFESDISNTQARFTPTVELLKILNLQPTPSHLTPTTTPDPLTKKPPEPSRKKWKRLARATTPNSMSETKNLHSGKKRHSMEEDSDVSTTESETSVTVKKRPKETGFHSETPSFAESAEIAPWQSRRA